MELIAALALLGWVVTACAFLHHIRETKRSTDLQISGLLNRIQAPDTAAVQARVDAQDPLEAPPYVEWDNDADYWASKTPTRN